MRKIAVLVVLLLASCVTRAPSSAEWARIEGCWGGLRSFGWRYLAGAAGAWTASPSLTLAATITSSDSRVL